MTKKFPEVVRDTAEKSTGMSEGGFFSKLFKKKKKKDKEKRLEENITNIYVLVTTAFDNGTNTIDVGISTDTDLFVDGLTVGTVGNHRVAAATTGDETKWKNTGTEDTTIVFISPGSGNGAGILTVEYLQNRALA